MSASLEQQPSTGQESLVNIRVLGWMFVFATSTKMSEELAAAVTSCDTGIAEPYSELGKFYIDQ